MKTIRQGTLWLGAVVWAAACAVASEAPKPRNSAKLVVVNDDGFTAFYSGSYRTAEELRNAVRRLDDTPVAVLEWCVVSGSRTNFPSRTTELIGAGMKEFPRRGDQLAAETLAQMASHGVDTLAVVAAACHEAGIACYASMRMNGDYPEKGGASWGDSLARFFNSTFWWEHPEFHVRSAGGEDRTKLSYAYAAVQDFKLGIIREAVERDIDGVNLDFQRHPEFFGHEGPMADAFRAKYGVEARTVPATDPRWFPLRAEIMTGFVRKVRAALDGAGKQKGRRLALSARIDWKAYRAWGCDPAEWLREGLLDMLVVSQRGLGGYEFDLAPFVSMARGGGCAVLFGEEAVVKGHDRTAEEDRLIAAGKMTPPASTLLSVEDYRSRAERWLAAGADGLHLFNESRLEVMRAVSPAPPASPP